MIYVDLNSLSDMNYHDCFDSFACFFVTGYQTASSSHQEADFKHLFCRPLFPKVGQFFAFRWYSNLGNDVALAQKNSTSHETAPKKNTDCLSPLRRIF